MRWALVVLEPGPFLTGLRRSGARSAAVFLSLRESLRPRIWMRIGLPKNPYVSRSRFSRNRSYEKCSLVTAFVNNTNVGGATLACAAYITRTLRFPAVTGGEAVVTL